MGLILTDDIWGVRRLVKELFDGHIYYLPYKEEYDRLDKEFFFNVFFNQKIPPVWLEGKSSVLRHLSEIKKLLESHQIGEVWTEKPNRGYSCDKLSLELFKRIKQGEVRLLTYLEIEKEKVKWQEKPSYRQSEGYSNPIEEEYIQLRIKK